MSANLQPIFHEYTKKKEFMVSRDFVKMLRDAKLLPKPISQTDADIVFTSFGKTAKRITYPQCLEALSKLAERCKVDENMILDTLSKLEGPILTGTQAEATRFYDDKSAYTGTHKHGGPSTTDVAVVARSKGDNTGGDKQTMASLMNRGEADIRGVPKNSS